MCKHSFLKILLLIPSVFLMMPAWVYAETISIKPDVIIQGEPILISFVSDNNLSKIASVTFGGLPLRIFSYQSKPSALIGVDLKKQPGDYKLVARFSDGRIVENVVNVKARPKVNEELGIPDKLGGNTAISQLNLVNSLSSENLVLTSLYSGSKSYWTKPFQDPLKNIFVTDSYGYTRITGTYSIIHKGTDFRAAEGTPVLAMNRGVVRLTKNFRTYGKTVVIDHGLGLMTIYMHLSKVLVSEGELVLSGQTVGLSGHTGYAEKPHLHVSVWINKISVDPVKFLELFK